MISVELILETFERQKNEILENISKTSISRSSLQVEPALPNFARIITGIRRSGKSTLISKDLFSADKSAFYLNFDEPVLYNFSATDFVILENAIDKFQKEQNGSKNLYFDEIQNVDGWEVFVNAQLKKGNLVTVTGSNASLLSSELGTRLTGRHLDYELFPFNFSEFCEIKQCKKSPENFLE